MFLIVSTTSCKQNCKRNLFLGKMSLNIVMRNRNIVWKHGKFEISGVAVERIHQNNKRWWLLWGIAQWKWLWGCFSHFLLLWLWCQRFWGSTEDRYRSKRLWKCSLRVIVSWIAKICQSLTVIKGWLLSY